MFEDPSSAHISLMKVPQRTVTVTVETIPPEGFSHSSETNNENENENENEKREDDHDKLKTGRDRHGENVKHVLHDVNVNQNQNQNQNQSYVSSSSDDGDDTDSSQTHSSQETTTNPSTNCSTHSNTDKQEQQQSEHASNTNTSTSPITVPVAVLQPSPGCASASSSTGTSSTSSSTKDRIHSLEQQIALLTATITSLQQSQLHSHPQVHQVQQSQQQQQQGRIHYDITPPPEQDSESDPDESCHVHVHGHRLRRVNSILEHESPPPADNESAASILLDAIASPSDANMYEGLHDLQESAQGEENHSSHDEKVQVQEQAQLPLNAPDLEYRSYPPNYEQELRKIRKTSRGMSLDQNDPNTNGHGHVSENHHGEKNESTTASTTARMRRDSISSKNGNMNGNGNGNGDDRLSLFVPTLKSDGSGVHLHSHKKDRNKNAMDNIHNEGDINQDGDTNSKESGLPPISPERTSRNVTVTVKKLNLNASSSTCKSTSASIHTSTSKSSSISKLRTPTGGNLSVSITPKNAHGHAHAHTPSSSVSTSATTTANGNANANANVNKLITPTNTNNNTNANANANPISKTSSSTSVLSTTKSKTTHKNTNNTITNSNSNNNNTNNNNTTSTPLKQINQIEQQMNTNAVIDFIRGLNIDSRRQDGSASEDVDANMEEFLRVPFRIETLLFFGIAVCFDSFLNLLTVTPLKFIWSCCCLVCTILRPGRGVGVCRFHRRHLYQVLRVFVILAVYKYALCPISLGWLYHWIRGQAMLKLYVLMAMVEVFDRLMCSFGQDALDSLYWNTTRRPYHPRMIASTIVVLVYAGIHSLILFVHAATLNVAMNSADSALMSLLIGGNFAEIKSTVFKKYNKQNLFKITTSDICERFKLVLFLGLVLLLNCSQGGMNQEMVNDYIYMSFIIMGAEMVCDWIKHSFITKFNFIKSSVYLDYSLVLAGDITGIGHGHEAINVEHTHAVVKRLGFAQIPLICVAMRYFKEAFRYADTLTHDGDSNHVLYSFAVVWTHGSWRMVSSYLFIFFLFLLGLKFLLGYAITRKARSIILYGPLDGHSDPAPKRRQAV